MLFLWETLKNSKTCTLLDFGMSSSVNCERVKIGEQTVVIACCVNALSYRCYSTGEKQLALQVCIYG